MGSLFRSHAMTMVQIIDHNDGAREVVELLGELGVMQLVDLNAGTMGNRRTFSDDLRRNDAVMKRLEFLERACEAAGVPVRLRDEHAPLMSRTQLAGLDGELRSLEREIADMKAEERRVLLVANGLRENLHLLRLGATVYDGGTEAVVEAEAWPTPSDIELAEERRSSSLREGLLQQAGTTGAGAVGRMDAGGMLNLVAGVISRSNAHQFERLAHRLSRGNCMVYNEPIDEPLLLASRDPREEPAAVPKNAFLVFFSGEVLRAKLLKVAGHLSATIYPLHETGRLVAESRIRRQLAEVQQVIAATQAKLRDMLRSIGASCDAWKYALLREQAPRSSRSAACVVSTTSPPPQIDSGDAPLAQPPLV